MKTRLAGAENLNLDKEEVLKALEQMGEPAAVRGETFTLEKFAMLSNCLYKVKQ